MASLTEVYEGHVRTVTTPRRLYFGASLFVAGTAMVVGSIGVATTGVGEQFGLSLYGARELAGVLAGLGLPAALLGVFTVLPAGRVSRALSIVGAGISVLGVALFRVAYPYRWLAAGDPLAVATVLVYFAGAITALGCLFAGLATLKTRSDPGGTARMEITEEGRVRLVEEADAGSAFGSVGLFGREPDGEVSTQTNRDSPPRPEESSNDPSAEVFGADAGAASGDETATNSGAPSTDPLGGTPTADGGSAAVDADPGYDAEFVDAARERGRPDEYCGNCEHFEYVKVDGDIRPYCGLDQRVMDEMDACEQWSRQD